jgi:beta-lactamase superfamily II metal-dependent hydrolase
MRFDRYIFKIKYMQIINYQNEMLSVGAADAFIIYIIDENGEGHLILVDAGKYEDGQKVIDHIRKYYSNPVIDLAIVTHPDDDHYGGFLKMLEKIRDKDAKAISINCFWVHDPSCHISSKDVKYGWTEKNAKAEACSVLELNGINLLQFIDSLKIERIEPFAYSDDEYTFGHPDFMLIPLGPTEEYYKSLVPNFRHSLIKYDDNDVEKNSDILENGKIYSKTLDDASDDTSTHNKSSLIFIFSPNNADSFLFMGDAGKESFIMIPKVLKGFAKNVSWLKVPHHGSKHNIDSSIINWIKPKVAYISTGGIGNPRCTINALKASGCSVYSTHSKKSDILHNDIWGRSGYTTATPL